MKKTASLAALILTGTASLSSAALVGLWRFENDFTDSSDQSNNGANVGGVTFAASQAGFGQAGNFGSSSRVVVPHSTTLNATSELTIAAWVNHTSNGFEGILAKAPSAGSGANFPGNYELRIDNSSNRLNFGYERTDGAGGGSLVFTQSTATVSPNVWTHIALTVDSSGVITHYINGVGVASGQAATAFGEVNTNPLNIGARGDLATTFDGLMDDVAVFNEALTSAQITTIGTGDFSAFVVPEPSGTALLGLALLVPLLHRRRRTHIHLP